MASWTPPDAMRAEAHFGDRVVACYADRRLSFDALLRDAADRNGSGCALVCGQWRRSWAELDGDVERLAAGLAARGISAGDRVLLFLRNRGEFVVFVFALVRLGAIAVPVSVREQASGVDYIAKHSEARAIVHESKLASKLPRDLPLMRFVVEAGSDALEAYFEDGPAPVHKACEEDVTFILYTSGTTGRPKGAMITHLAMVHAARAYADCMGLGFADTAVCVVPLSHVTALAALLAPITRAAGSLVILDGFDVSGFLDSAVRERMTHCVLVPAMYNLLLIRADLTAHDLSAWRIGAFGGAPMPVPTIEKLAVALPSLALMNCYGATETTLAAAIMPPDHALSHHDCVGQESPGTSIRVMDESGCEVGTGRPGELWISGPSVTRGYWRDEVATRANLIGGWWRSGDIGSKDAQGFVRVHDRIKDMINRGGHKIFSSEVENVLAAHPVVREAAVLAKACPVLGERVVAVVVIEPSQSSEMLAAALQRHCGEVLADYKVPETIWLVSEALPRNANGKVMKATLVERFLSQEL